MDNICFLYCLFDKKDCRIRYIGVSVQPEQRFKNHQYESKNPSTSNLGKSKWLKTVKELSYKILFSGTEKECYQKEIELIFKYKKKKNLVNSTVGGDKPPKLNELDPIHYNKTISKISEKAKNRKVSDITKQKMSETHKKIPPIWLESKGCKNGRAYSVNQYDLNGNFVKKWDCAKDAINELKLNKTAITDCLKGRQKTAGGFIWKKYTPYKA
jgi:hypothetical protein